MSEIIVKLTDSRIKLKGGEYVRDLVRCKDCKHRPIDTQEEGNGFDYEFPEEYSCPGYCDDGYYSQRFKDDFYCAWGERAGE